MKKKKYPTKQEILKEPRPEFKKGTLTIISGWKKIAYKYWKDKNENQKLWELQLLAEMICDLYQKPYILTAKGKVNRYKKKGYIIELTKPISVISFLHELAHHLFGPNELTACRWSVWLYQLRFRKDYNKLIWQEHTLVKKHSGVAKKKSPYKKLRTVTTK